MMEQPKDWNIQFLDVNDNVKYQISTFGTEDKAVKFARKLELRWRTRPANERVNKEKGKSIRSRRNENADEVAEETKCFAKFNDNCVCTGFMALQRIPSWLININPKGRVKKYVFEPQSVVDRLLKEEE